MQGTCLKTVVCINSAIPIFQMKKFIVLEFTPNLQLASYKILGKLFNLCASAPHF